MKARMSGRMFGLCVLLYPAFYANNGIMCFLEENAIRIL